MASSPRKVEPNRVGLVPSLVGLVDSNLVGRVEADSTLVDRVEAEPNLVDRVEAEPNLVDRVEAGLRVEKGRPTGYPSVPNRSLALPT